MRYPAIITKEGKKTLATFPDCPGCQTEADPREDICIQAADALTGWLEAHLLLGRVPPQPSTKKPKGKVLWVEVPAGLAVKLLIRWARNEAGLTQAQLAKRGLAQLRLALLRNKLIRWREQPKVQPDIFSGKTVASVKAVKADASVRRR